MTKQRGELVTNSRSTCCLRIAFELTIGPSSYEEANIGSLLHEVSHEERDPEACPDHDEEWKTGHAGNLRDLRDKAIPHREELGSQRADRDRRRSQTHRLLLDHRAAGSGPSLTWVRATDGMERRRVWVVAP